MVRVGHGFDVHRLVAGRDLILGGHKIPSPYGLAGHSDADVLLHAVIDAVLGALALGDIGQWFPDSDARYRGASSAALLQTVLNCPEVQGWELLNLDSTIVAERPRLAPHIPALRDTIAAIFGVPPTRVSVKATTVEGIGGIGRGEGIAAHAFLLLGRQP